jgi:hypothetical protein
MAQERFKNTGTETIFGDALKVRYPKLPDGDGFEPEAVSQERVHRDGPLSPRRC